jgi:ribosome-binding factor A
MASIRQAKVESLLTRELSNILQRDVAGWGVHEMVTLTVVRISPDLSYARVYLSIFPNQRPNEVLEIIRHKVSYIRGVAGKILGQQLRVVPELVFLIDDSLDYAERIDELLNK